MAIDWDRLFGSEQPQGYYDRIQKSYQIPKVERLEKANGECQRITKLNARSFIGVIFLDKILIVRSLSGIKLNLMSDYVET